MDNMEFIEDDDDNEVLSDVRSQSSSEAAGDAPRSVPWIDTAPPGSQPFDNDLPVKHAYLGDDLEELSGRTLLEEGSVHLLPLWPQRGVVLVPGQTLPLTIFYPPSIEMLRKSIASDRTFGVVCVSNLPDGSTKIADIGTTAEIYAYHDYNDADPQFRVKAKGRQRFKVIEAKTQAHGYAATVLILPEVTLPNLVAPGNKRNRRDLARLSHWPGWLHSLYDTQRLVARTTELLKHLRTGEGGQIPTNPVALSWWVAQSLPLEDDKRLDLLRIDSAIQRLRWAISILENCQVLCCQGCSLKIADQKDVFSMSAEGPQGAYVNPGGYVHETMTLHRANGLVIQRVEPSYEFSWFPGYGWTIVECSSCSRHMGWLFTTTNPRLHPHSFFGLCRQSLVIRIHPNCENRLRPVQ